MYCRITGGELFDEIVAREFYSESDARYVNAYNNNYLTICFKVIVFNKYWTVLLSVTRME